MGATAPFDRDKYDVLIDMYPANKDGAQTLALVFSDDQVQCFELTKQQLQEQLEACEGSGKLFAQGFLADRIGILGLRARLQVRSDQPPIIPIRIRQKADASQKVPAF